MGYIVLNAKRSHTPEMQEDAEIVFHQVKHQVPPITPRLYFSPRNRIPTYLMISSPQHHLPSQLHRRNFVLALRQVSLVALPSSSLSPPTSSLEYRAPGLRHLRVVGSSSRLVSRLLIVSMVRVFSSAKHTFHQNPSRLEIPALHVEHIRIVCDHHWHKGHACLNCQMECALLER